MIGSRKPPKSLIRSISRTRHNLSELRSGIEDDHCRRNTQFTFLRDDKYRATYCPGRNGMDVQEFASELEQAGAEILSCGEYDNGTLWVCIDTADFREVD